MAAGADRLVWSLPCDCCWAAACCRDDSMCAASRAAACTVSECSPANRRAAARLVSPLLTTSSLEVSWPGSATATLILSTSVRLPTSPAAMRSDRCVRCRLGLPAAACAHVHSTQSKRRAADSTHAATILGRRPRRPRRPPQRSWAALQRGIIVAALRVGKISQTGRILRQVHLASQTFMTLN